MNRRDLLRASAALAASCAPWKQQQSSASSGQGIAPHPRRSVVVIGAGMAGLAAARRLVDEYGLDGRNQVIVLEGRNRVGGRVHSHDGFSSTIELGANWIHGPQGNPITGLANQFGATTVATPDTARVYDVNGSAVPPWFANSTYLLFLDAYQEALDWIQNLPQDQSLAQTYLDVGAGQGLSPQGQRMVEYWTRLSEGEYTTTNAQLSSYHHAMGSSFSGVDRVFPQGYHQIPEGLAQGLDIRLDTVVERIDTAGGRVFIETDRGRLVADRCIVTLPLGVLKAGAVEFLPGLPTGLQSAIDRMGFGKVCRLALEFPSVFWPSNPTFLSFLGSEPRLATDWLNVASYSQGAPILHTWTVDEYAVELEAMDLSSAVARVMHDLRLLFGAGVPDPIQVIKTDWTSNDFTRGSYSFPALGSGPADYAQFAQAVDGKLYFAGEHTHPTYPSTVHGAYLSGRLAAERLVLG